jgi:sugar transferase (PEP-CTERM system associated)
MIRFLGIYIPAKSLILVVTESALILASLWLALWIRLGELNGFTADLPAGYGLPLRLGMVVGVCVICFYYSDLYDMQITSRKAEMLIRLMQALGASSLILALLYYMVPDLGFGRGISAVAAAIAGLLLVGWRLLVDAAGGYFRPEQRLVVVGTGSAGIRLVRELIDRPELNFKVMGFLDEDGENIGKRLVNPGIIGGVSDLEALVKRDKVDRVVVSFAERRGQMPVQTLLHVKFAGTAVEDAHSLYEKLTGRIMLERLTPSWLILSEGFRKGALQLFAKRIVDIVFSLLALTLCAPLCLILSLAIYLESGGPILFRQERVGLNDKRFRIVKFRSMRTETQMQEPAWASEGDRRITRLGRVIRRYRLDEIPQFINVLEGDMSLVGPRPEQPGFVEMLEREIPYYSQRHTVRPGITGWAQIKYKYGASSEDAKNKLEYELFYIKHMSLSLDLLIMFRTVQVVLFGWGAV